VNQNINLLLYSIEFKGLKPHSQTQKNSMLSEKISQFLNTLSLTKKMLIVVTILGALIWSIHNQILTANVEKIFMSQLNEQLDLLTSSSRMRFDRNLRKFKTLIKIFRFHPGLIQYLSTNTYSRSEKNNQPTEILTYSRPPSWFPQLSIIRNLIHPRYVLLLDETGEVREIYHSWEKNIPEQLRKPDNLLLESSHSQIRLTEINDRPFVIISESIKNQQGENYWLIFATPIDDELLTTLQSSDQAREIIALIDYNKGNTVIASSRPDKIKQGSTEQTLKNSYILAGKLFFDYGASDLNIRFATLIPTEQVKKNMQALLYFERRQYVFFALIYMLAAYVLGIFAVRRIDHMKSRIKQFTSEFDSHYPFHIKEGGDQLYELEKHFFALTTIIRDTNKGLKQTAEQLKIEKDEQGKLIVELQQTHEQLLHAEKMASLGSLVAGVSHEINTPIGVSMTGVTYIQKETQAIKKLFDNGEISKQDLSEYLEDNTSMTKSIVMSLDKANDLVRSFKQVAVDQNSEALRVFNLHDYLNDILLSLHSKIKPAKITIINNIDKKLEVNSFPGIFSQIFTNMITNSLIHGFDNKPNPLGEIIISGQLVDQRLIISYADNGTGIDENLITRIFEPFFTTKLGQGGSGLGMYITYNLVTQKLAGNIRAENLPNSGLSFYIDLPNTA